MFTVNNKPVNTFEDGDIVRALQISELLEDGVIQFTLAEPSSLPYARLTPYAWLVEGFVPNDIGDASALVRIHVASQVKFCNFTSIPDDELVEAIMNAGLADAAIAYVNEWKERGGSPP